MLCLWIPFLYCFIYFCVKLMQVFNGLRMVVIPSVCMVYKWETMLNEEGKIKDMDINFAAYIAPLRTSLLEMQKVPHAQQQTINLT